MTRTNGVLQPPLHTARDPGPSTVSQGLIAGIFQRYTILCRPEMESRMRSLLIPHAPPVLEAPRIEASIRSTV